MPVRAERKALYGEGWRDFSAYIRFERADGRCECDGRCGDELCRGLVDGRCNARHGHPHPVNGKRVVLTVAHFTHEESCRDEDKVGGYCARCHLAYDREHHAETRKATRAAKAEAERRRIMTTTARMAFEAECATGKRVGRQ